MVSNIDIVFKYLTIPPNKAIKGNISIRIRQTCIFDKG